MWLVCGPSLLSGIGQVSKKYCDLVQGKYVEHTSKPDGEKYDVGLAFVLPIRQILENTEKILENCSKKYYMTVCETETVHPSYGIFAKYSPILVPSEFSKNVLERQFPDIQCIVLRHWSVPRPLPPPATCTPYRFYTIGNVIDPRKNIRMLLDVFVECVDKKLFVPNTQLVIKATCSRKFDLKPKHPSIMIMNGLMEESQLESIHKTCSCYVNCSHSEGVGMGAVEAALHGRPVIISDYGGCKEYVDTPYIIPSPVDKIGFNDFLFTKDMEWGHPDREMLKKHMLYLNHNDIREYDHSHTITLMKEVECNLREMQL